MNTKLFMYMHKITQKNKLLEHYSFLISNYSSYFFILFYIYYIFIITLTNKYNISLFILIPFTTLLCNKILKKAIKKDRPFVTLNIKTKLVKESYSFPSNHACASLIIALSILQVNNSVGIFLILCSILTGVSLIFAGVHYPLDILAGWSMALIFSLFFN